MPTPVLSEYRNQNNQRQYPFADDAMLTDSTGQRLQVDFLVDAMLYPIDVQGRPYLSKIDIGERTIHFSDSVTGADIGVAEFTLASEDCSVYEPDYNRHIGVLVFGNGLSSIFTGATVRVFTPDQTPLAPTAFIPLNQPGVRGFLLPNGNLVTGDIIFEGRNGIEVTSEVMPGGIPILSIDCVGVPSVPLEDCRDVCIPIREVCFQRAAGSAIAISEYGSGVLALYSSCFDLNDICINRRSRRLPDASGRLPFEGDVCVDPPEPPDPPCPDVPDEVCFLIAEVGPYLLITNPSSLDTTNPISVQSVRQVGGNMARISQARPVNQASDLDGQIRAFTNPAFAAEALLIGIRGLSQGRRT